MKVKICKKCDIKKPLNDFHKHKRGKFGVRSICKLCTKSENVKEKEQLFLLGLQKCTVCHEIKKIDDFYKLSNNKYGHRSDCKDCFESKRNKQERSEYLKNWRKNNKSLINKYFSEAYKNNIRFRLGCNLRNRIWEVLKRNKKSLNTMFLLGCEIDYLMYHIQEQFKSGMTWDNYGDWHIDHIKPCAKFDLSKPEEQYKCFNYTNLQPLWAEENLKKSDKYNAQI